MLEYVNMCGQCVIGVVVKKVGDKTVPLTTNGAPDIDLFDIMQDNSCQIDIEQNYSIQKPKQVVGFNAKGKLAHGNSAAKMSGAKNYNQ
jgi:hypothetical protein